MKIRTRFLLTIFLFGLVVAAISASAIITNQRVGKANEQERLADIIAQGASELSNLAEAYLIYGESQQLERWQSSFASFSTDVASLQTYQPEQEALISNIQANTQRLKEVFDSVVAAIALSSQDQGGTTDLAFLQVSWSRIEVQSQALVSDASRLSRLFADQENQLHRTNTIVIIALIGTFGAYFLANYLLIQRRTLKSMATLRAGTAVIGSGNLDFRIEEKSSDEIGDLSRAFNRMAVDLKAVTASKTDLQREVEERKKVEEALKQSNTELEVANKELEAFSYSVSHDLRAPLRSMEGFSAALLEDYADKLDDEGKQYLRHVQESSDLMARLIDDMLKLSHVTRSDMNRETVNLSEMAHKIVTELERAEPDRKVKLNIAPDIMAYGDRYLLGVVLENLLGNAWKFSSKVDSPLVEMGTVDHNGKQAYFVRDNGVGFDMTYAHKLFQPFQRLHKASEYPGTGIGLATVQRVIRRHGGEVWAESRPGEGTTFFFTLG